MPQFYGIIKHLFEAASNEAFDFTLYHNTFVKSYGCNGKLMFL